MNRNTRHLRERRAPRERLLRPSESKREYIPRELDLLHLRSDSISQMVANRQRHRIGELSPRLSPPARRRRCSQKPEAFLNHCEATRRATVSSLSRLMPLVSTSGKTIGSSFFAG